MLPSKQIHHFAQINVCLLMNVHQGQRRQPPLSHASSVVHVQPS